MTTTVSVERIDILEGPNLEGLLRSFPLAAALEDQGEESLPRSVETWFKEVRFYDEQGFDLRLQLAGALSFRGVLNGIRYLGLTRDNKHDFVIFVDSSLGTFGGLYNTKTRKGSLNVMK